MKTQRINPAFGDKHQAYIRRAIRATISVAEGAVRAGKTVDNIAAFAYMIDKGVPDRIHLATGSTAANAKLNIGDSNGLGLEHIFRGRCRWTKYRGNEALVITSHKKEYVVIFAGAAKADSFKKIRGNSYGMWIATEINLHHEDTIKEAFNRQLAAKVRRVFWDLNPSAPNHPIYEKYIDLFSTQLGEQYNYQHFTIRDNSTITEKRLREIELQYIPGSVWYRRDILGERCVAEGAIYTSLVDHPQSYVVQSPPPVMFATIGVDFGGNGSATAFNCTGFTQGLQEIVTLNEYYKKGIMSPAELERDFISFARECMSICTIAGVYCDSAEQTLIQGLRTACARAGVGLSIRNARKGEINERIRFFCRMQAQGRHKILAECRHTLEAFQTAVWDAKHITEDVRLDDGTYNVDSLDAQEYAVEPYMRQMLRI